MPITRAKATTPKTAEAFIGAAPDAPARKGVMKGRKEQISLTLAPGLLAKVDSLAQRMGQSRAAVIGLAVYRLVEAEKP